jgi:hypothetical protein
MLQDKQAEEEEQKMGAQAESNRPAKGVTQGRHRVSPGGASRNSLAAGEDAVD